MIVYLAGPITGLSFNGAEDWRTWFTEQLVDTEVKSISPLRGKDYLESEGVLLDQYLEHPMSTEDGITTRDRWDCQRADFLVVNLLGAERVSIGTMIELGWADDNQIPIVLVIEDEGNIHDHAMVRSVSGYRVNNLEGAVQIVKAASL